MSGTDLEEKYPLENSGAYCPNDKGNAALSLKPSEARTIKADEKAELISGN